MRTAVWMLSACASVAFAAPARADEGAGLRPANDGWTWPRWQARLSLSPSTPRWRAALGDAEASGLKIQGLMGDYYFGRSAGSRDAAGGFRATSGLIAGSRSTLWLGQPQAAEHAGGFSVGQGLFGASPWAAFDPQGDSGGTMPYVGIGYTGVSARGGWSYSADFGLVARSVGSAVKLGRVFNGTQSLDEVLRDMRLAPVVQLGVSYAF